MVQQYWQRSVYLLFFDVAFTDMKSLFGQERDHIMNVTDASPNLLILMMKINQLNQCPLPKKWSFPLRISSANTTKSAGNCGFGHIYWRNPSWTTSFFVPQSDREMGPCYISIRLFNYSFTYLNWSSHTEVFLRKGVLKICSNFTGEHPYRSVISIKLL